MLSWLFSECDMESGVEGGGNVYFRWERRSLPTVWEHFEDHGTLPWGTTPTSRTRQIRPK